MGLFSKIRSLFGKARAAFRRPGPRVAARPSHAGPASQRVGVGGKGPAVHKGGLAGIHRPRATSPYTIQTNAAFTESEMSNFLLGHKVACRSSWVNTAQWNENTETLTLNLGTERKKDYDFPADEDIAVEFAEAFSKGFWYWNEWRGKYGITKPVALESAHLPHRVRRVL